MHDYRAVFSSLFTMFRGIDDDPFFRDFNSSIQSNFGRLGGGDNIFRDMDRMMGDMMGDMPGPSLALEGPRGGNRGGEVANRDRPANRDRDGFFSFPDMCTVTPKRGTKNRRSIKLCLPLLGDLAGLRRLKGYKDSSTKTQRMQYGRHIGDRDTIQERSQIRDAREEKTDHIGFEESQAGEFDAEWRKKAGGLYRGGERAGRELPRGRGERANRPAIAHK
eukprot:sb/3469842/